MNYIINHLFRVWCRGKKTCVWERLTSDTLKVLYRMGTDSSAHSFMAFTATMADRGKGSCSVLLTAKRN